MSVSQMRYVMLSTTILVALEFIASHEIGRAIDAQPVWKDPVWRNYITANEHGAALRNATSLVNGTLLYDNGTSLDAMSRFEFEALDKKAGFYTHFFPRNVFIHALLVPLQYYWNIYLERFFPTRPRGKAEAVSTESEKQNDRGQPFDEDDAGREEEIVKRWIAQGKVKRSSISLFNTVVKWALDLSLGKVLFEVVFHLIDGVVEWNGVKNTIDELPGNIFYCWVTSILSAVPLISLAGFVLIPAHQRVVFGAGLELVASVVFNVLFAAVAPWAIMSDFAQKLMKDVADTTWKTEKNLDGVNHLFDEL